MNDANNLQRFVDAQAGVYDDVLAELRAGCKRSHWMWFIFPQLAGLGRSATAERFAIASRAEAIAYAEHPILGSRLRECTQVVLDVEGRTAEEIFHFPDVLKLRSSMTLFAATVNDNKLFLDMIEKYYDGEQDERTLELLANE